MSLIKSFLEKSLSFLSKPKTLHSTTTPPKPAPKLDTLNTMRSALSVYKNICELGRNPEGRIFFEIGTGHAPITALTYWLLGANKVITTDDSHDFDVEFLIENLKVICEKKTEVENLLQPGLKKERLYELIALMDDPFHMQRFFELTEIDYWAPADPANINLPHQSVDFHISFAPSEAILKEGQRLIKKNGLFVDKAKLEYKI